MKTKYFILIIALLPFGTNCQKNKAIYSPQTIELPANGDKIVAANNTFGFLTFRKLYAADSTANIMFSPLSLHIAMTMALNGACNQTAQEIQTALKLDNLSLTDANNCYKKLISELTKVDDKVTLVIANSFWFDKNLILLSDYKTILQNYYFAEVQNVDFLSSTTIKTINDWCSQKTNGKIPKIIDNLSPGEVAALLNALYFNAKWYSQFDASSTETKNFYLFDNSTIKVETMYQQNDFAATVTEMYTIVELPYGQGNFVIDLILPAPNRSISEVIDSLVNFNNIISSLHKYKVSIFLPKFEYESQFDLISPLKALGINIAFTNDAQFCKISNTSLQISKIKQKTYIKVNEEGTEAAAVTHVGFLCTSAPPNQTLLVRFERPFLYLIREKTTNTIIFIGTIANPQS